MATTPERASHFPAIERKHGQPMSFWLERMREIGDRKYEDQIAFLREEHGFSRAHANALVLHFKGSLSARRFATLDEYLAGHDEVAAATVRAIFGAIRAQYPEPELVIAWNQPMLKLGKRYLFGVSVHRSHLLMAAFDDTILERFALRLAGYTVNKKTIRVPLDWVVDEALVADMVGAQLE
jgi:uncharacterized protein